jgi:hypothetical protein
VTHINESRILLMPDWVLMGARNTSPDAFGTDRAFMVFASSSLTYAELKATVRRVDFWDSPVTIPLSHDYELSCHMQQVQIAYGATFQEAIAKLFGQWNPDAPKPALESGPLALEAKI